MRKNGDGSSQKSAATSEGVVSRSARSSFSSLSNYLRVISSGASTVARSAASAASSAINRDIESHHDQVLWAGFNKLEKEDGETRRVILLAFQSGFQVWDVEDTENVHVLVSEHDGQVSFLQMIPNPITSTADMFYESRPLLAVCGDSSWEDTSSRHSNLGNPANETVAAPTNVSVYSLKSHSYVHTMKFRSIIYTVRCSSRIVAVLQAAQIHCLSATTFEKDYTIVTNSIEYGSSSVGYGPLAVGPRWIAYKGSRIANPNSAVFTSENVQDADSRGVVIIKDIISKSVIAQFKAHKSPISALCFDPSGMLLATASTQGHNINIFRIMPTRSDENTTSFAHLFILHRGMTDGVIQDICFSNDSKLIAVSSSRGTSHLFEINPNKEVVSPITLRSTKIRSGNSSGLIGTITGAASAAAGMVVGGSLPGTITATFCYCDEPNRKKYYGSGAGNSSMMNLLVFAPSGLLTQYALRPNQDGVGHESAARSRFDRESGLETEEKVAVEEIRSWSMIQNKSRREMQIQDGYVYGGGTSMDSKSKVFPEIVRKQSVEKATKKGMPGVKDKDQLYIFEAELQTHPQPQQPLWAKQFRFQKMVLNEKEESSGGGGEMAIEGIQTRMIEARTRDLVPVWGNVQSPTSQQVINESIQSPRNTTQSNQGWGHGTETDLGAIHSKEVSSKSEEMILYIPKKRAENQK